MQIDLLYFPDREQPSVPWDFGELRVLPTSPKEIQPVVDSWLQTSTAEYCLFWDMSLGPPDQETLLETICLPGDVWHSGLKVGMSGAPAMIDFVNPTWMLNRDVDPNIVSSSWRLSLKACLVRTVVLRQLGGIDPTFDSVDGAALEMGHRFIKCGAFVRHVPSLVKSTHQTTQTKLSTHDQLRFIRQQYGQKWVAWSIGRALLNGCSLRDLQSEFGRLRRELSQPLPEPFKRSTEKQEDFNPRDWHEKITILIPTLERYSYLRNELSQLRKQTIRPFEIIVVDQTPASERESTLITEFADLPLRVFHQDRLGQCTARNAGLLASRGEYILFSDDDNDRIAPDFLERFARTFQTYDADMVAGVADEVGAGARPFNCTFMRVADTFPTTMVKRQLLEKSGLMDFAYDRAKRADGDLGMRCYCTGALMVLDPKIRLLHHRAPSGGLRKHGVRVMTFARARNSITQRNLPTVSDIYLALRYFSPRQVREELWLRTFSSFTTTGSVTKKILKVLYGVFSLPSTLCQIRRRYLEAKVMLGVYPQIPELAQTTNEKTSTPFNVRATGVSALGPSVTTKT